MVFRPSRIVRPLLYIALALACGAAAASAQSTSEVRQSGHDNQASIDQSAHAVGRANSSAVQDGELGVVSVSQIGGVFSNSDAQIHQLADSIGARASVAQSSDGSKRAEIAQGGLRPVASIVQLGHSELNLASIAQSSGADQRAEIAQQSGEGHTSSIVQTQSEASWTVDATSVQRGDLQRSEIRQDGDRSLVSVEQSGLLGSSRVLQAGRDSRAELVQDGTQNDSEIVQGGDGNRTSVLQNELDSPAPGSTSAHSSSVLQSGDANIADVAQTTRANQSRVEQGGDGNAALVRQSSASGSTSAISQPGSGNSATVRQ